MSQTEFSVEALFLLYPESCRQDLHNTWEAVQATLKNNAPLLSEDQIKDCFDIWFKSPFVAENFRRYPGWLSEFVIGNSLQKCKPLKEKEAELGQLFASIANESELMQTIRQYRNKEMTRIVWRDLSGRASLEETLLEMSDLADVCVRACLDWLHEDLAARFGQPTARNDNGKACPQHMMVLGMGKLGARELNVSSDIDLIFVYPEKGETNHPDKPIENQTFFTRLGQKLIMVLDQKTADGFVFRVDMRLRPYGESGALAVSLAAIEDYYQNQGRDWERFAMLKARVMTGDPDQAYLLQKILNPFVYRRYTDFSLIQSLRDLKRLIVTEVSRRGGDNIKLGSGGIREIEFIVQACQLIHGGRDPSLQDTRLMTVLDRLGPAGYLPTEDAETLMQAYRFLRRLEHGIQGMHDKQTQLLPDQEEDRERLVRSMALESWPQLIEIMDSHRHAVSTIFSQFIQESEADDAAEQGDNHISWGRLWHSHAEKSLWMQSFSQAGFDEPELCYQAMESIWKNRFYPSMSATAQQRLSQFIPLLLNAVIKYDRPSRTLSRVVLLVNAVLGRTVYLVLLIENPRAMERLCELCSASPWVAKHMAEAPIVLDELLDSHSLYSPPDKEKLTDELRQELLRIPEDDLEQQMDCLRTFKRSHVLRVAAAELSGKLPLMKVSDYLTFLAEVILQQVLNIAWRNLVEKYGVPSVSEENSGGSGFGIIGYGKMGGIELAYGSDLDLVFLYDANSQGMTSGPKSINNSVFYTRLGQRLIHILATSTRLGALYEVDMRLRPSGNSGMLTSTVAAFERYQQKDAWTWEHQALVRARFVAGDPLIGEKFQAVRGTILGQKRDVAVLSAEIVAMRGRMRAAALKKFGSAEKARLDIKQGQGGLIDIEFMTQFGVLARSCEYPELLKWTDNIRLLGVLQKVDCFEQVDTERLSEIYRILRAAVHRKSLADDDYHVDLNQYQTEAEQIVQMWERVLKVESEK